MEKKGRIPNDFVERLLARIDIVDVISSRVTLQRRGKEYIACCPFHSEKTPSFTVNPNKQFFYCFGCGASGNVLKFITDYEHLSFVDAIELLAQMDGQTVPYTQTHPKTAQIATEEIQLLDWIERATQCYEAQLKQHPQRQIVIDYLKKRGLKGETAQQYRLGYAPDSWDYLLSTLQTQQAKLTTLLKTGLITQTPEKKTYDRFRHRIMFPIRNRKGQVIAFGGRLIGEGTPKYLNSPETTLFHKSNELYGLYEMRRHLRHIDSVIVVEGYMDVIMLAQHGIQNVVATLGTATSTQQIEQLFKITKKIIFCFDGDRAGREAAWKALNSGLSTLKTGRQMYFLFLPEQEDPDSLVQKEGTSAFLQRLSQASTFSEYLFEYLEKDLLLDTLEGRAEIMRTTSQLIHKMPDSPLRDLIRDHLQTKTHSSTQVIAKHTFTNESQTAMFSAHSQPPKKHLSGLNPFKHATPFFKPRYDQRPIWQKKYRAEATQILPSSQSSTQHTSLNLAELGLTILINTPECAQVITQPIQFLLRFNTNETRLLFIIIRCLHTQKHLKTTAQLIQHFSGTSTQTILLRLAQNEPILESLSQQQQEIQAILYRLEQQSIQHTDPKTAALNKLRKGEMLTKEEINLIQQTTQIKK